MQDGVVVNRVDVFPWDIQHTVGCRGTAASEGSESLFPLGRIHSGPPSRGSLPGAALI